VEATADNVRPDDVIAFHMTCTASHSDKLFQPIEKGNMSSMMKKVGAYVKSKPATGAQWIHMMDLCALPSIAQELQLDALCQEHFTDLRFHSMLTPLLGGCCISLCYFQLDAATLSVGMYKLYVYVTHGFILSFVAELMPDTDAGRLAAGAKERDALVVKDLMLQGDVPVPIDCVFNNVVDRWDSLVARVAEQGPMFVFYQLAAETLSVQDTLLEFLSRSIFHFKKKTSFRMSYRQKRQLVKRLHIVNTAVTMVASCSCSTTQVVGSIIRFATDQNIAHNATAAAAAAGATLPLTMSALVPGSVLGIRQLPALYDLENSFRFVQSCLENEAKEVRVITDAIDSISQMRADNTALVLSLIATVFLPATFLTGVFGMNFQEHGGYTIHIVNSKYGPTVFYCLCFTLAVSLCMYYISMGWIEAFAFIRYLLSFTFGKRTMIHILGGDFEEDLNDDPPEKNEQLVNVAGLVQGGSVASARFSSGGELSDLTQSITHGSLNDGVASMPSAGTVRSPLSGQTGGDSSGEGGGQKSLLVPKRVAEALEEENRRQAEAQRRRAQAQMQGAQPSSSVVSSSVMRGSLANSYMRPSLQYRSRLHSSRAPSVAGSENSSVSWANK
jgi:hypothetical protein